MDLVRSFSLEELGADSLRVPIDIPRDQVRTPQWMPLGVYDLRVGMQSDLVKVLQNVVQVVCGRARGPTPLLVDINIHYRLLRLMFNRAYVEWDVLGDMMQSPPVFGVWHAYKQCCKVVRREFFSCFAYLEKGTITAWQPANAHLRNTELLPSPCIALFC